MLKIYLAIPIDADIDKGKIWRNHIFVLLKEYKIEVIGAGMGDSPIIDKDSSIEKKGIIVAHDLRELRGCDMVLAIVDQGTFCAGTLMEIEYARQLGIYSILLVLGVEKLKHIFLESLVDKVIYNIEELEDILSDVCGKGT